MNAVNTQAAHMPCYVLPPETRLTWPLTAVGPQYPPQYQQGPEDGAAKGNYAPAPYPAGAYQAQPVPGYAPGHYPAGA